MRQTARIIEQDMTEHATYITETHQQGGLPAAVSRTQAVVNS